MVQRTKKQCSIDGCESDVLSRNMCSKHYQRLRNSKSFKPMQSHRRVTPGERYGQVVTLERASTLKWLCRCDCGNVFEAYVTHLRSGDTTSCGHWRAAPNPDSYNAVHLRLKKLRGSASKYQCNDCGNQARDWSYVHSGVDEAHDQRDGYTLVYSTDITQYIPRCKHCHNDIDHAHRRNDEPAL